MTEKVLVGLDNQFSLDVEAVDSETNAVDFQPVDQIQELSPYGMLLAGVGSCTSMVVMTYAENHNISLDRIEIELDYQREFADDCEKCEDIDKYEEHIYETIHLEGDISEATEDKLKKIAHQCPLEKMLNHGVEIIHTTE